MDTLIPSLSFNSTLTSALSNSIESQRIIDDNDTTTSSESYDIGNYRDLYRHSINDFTKFIILKHHWVPPTNYIFPFSIYNKRNREEKWFCVRIYKWPFLYIEKFNWNFYIVWCTTSSKAN